MYQTLPSTGMYSNNQVCNHLLETNLVFFLYNCSDLRANNQNLSKKVLKIVSQNQNPTSQLRDYPAVPQRRGPPQHLPHSTTDPEHHEKSPLGSEIDFHQSVHGIQTPISCQCPTSCLLVLVPRPVCEQVGKELLIEPFSF